MRFFNFLTLAVAITISICAGYYSIVGLTAIFAASFWPIVIMGTVLEVGKITTAVWLHMHWASAKWWVKTYMIPAVAVLMLITSMGIFGFLSKAHLDSQSSGADNSLQIQLLDTKIAREQASIDDANTVLKQLDASVQALIDAQRIRNKDGALAVREAQKPERESLSADINLAEDNIAKLSEEKLTLASAQAKVEAEVGPIRYVASIIYGDNPDANLLERAVRWVILLLVAVFDPLAVVMILAASHGLAITKTQKKVEPIYVDREKIVEVEKIVEKLVPTEVYVDRIVEKSVPTEVIVEKIVEIPVGDESKINELKEEVSRLLEELVTKDKELEFRKRPELVVEAINSDVDLGNIGTASFGTAWPIDPSRGDLFLKIDINPNLLYKWNGRKWIEIDKARVDDTLVFDPEYIDHLIQQVRKGHVEYNDLSEMEQSQIAAKIRGQSDS